MRRDAILYILLQSCLIAAVFAAVLMMTGCKTVQVHEQVNQRDSTVIHYKDSTIWHHRDSVHLIEHHVTLADSSQLNIQFGPGGGTYNAQTGEATNVAAVQQTGTHHEQRDSSAYYRSIAESYQHTADSLSNQLTMLQQDYERLEKKTRTGYDRFCSWWFWITAVLLLIKVAAWVMEKIPTTAPYVIIARKFIPFL